jgi:hypothetical protein
MLKIVYTENFVMLGNFFIEAEITYKCTVKTKFSP